MDVRFLVMFLGKKRSSCRWFLRAKGGERIDLWGEREAYLLSAKRRLINLPPNNASPFVFLPLSLSLIPALRCRVFYFVEEISIVTEVLHVSSSPSPWPLSAHCERASLLCFFFLFLFLPLLFTFQRNADGKLISILLARPSRSRNYKETLVTRAIRRKREDGTWKEGERKNPPSLAMDFIVEHRRNDFNVARHVSADILTVS